MSDAAPEAGQSAIDADLATLKDDVARLTDTLSTLVQDSAETAKTLAREGAETARQKVSSAADDLSEQIEQNPLTAVLIALGVGYVVGALGRRR